MEFIVCVFIVILVIVFLFFKGNKGQKNMSRQSLDEKPVAGQEKINDKIFLMILIL